MDRRKKSVWWALALTLAIAVPVLALAVGEVETYQVLSPGEHPEGITFDRHGNLFYGNRAFNAQGLLVSTLHKVSADGSTHQVIATFAPSSGNALLGLVTDAQGDVWAAVDEGADHGVWKVAADGSHKHHIAGSEEIDFPNALTFDARGNLYVTDSGPVDDEVGGAIWKLPFRGDEMELWTDDEALAPLESNPFGGTPPGANGIAFFPPDSIYVANTEKGQIFRFEIKPDGSAGDAEALTGLFGVPTVDGIAVDRHGDIYGVLPGHFVLTLIGGFGIVPPVVKLNPQTGEVTRVTAAAFDNAFDVPLSLAFDTLPGGRTDLYITNGDLQIAPFPFGPGPRILRANAGEKGFFGR